MLAFAGFLVADQTGGAFAQKEAGGFPPSSSAVDALNNINGMGSTIGCMGNWMPS